MKNLPKLHALTAVLLSQTVWLCQPSFAETHQTTELTAENSQKIDAINQLDSLKTEQPLSMTLPDVQHFATEQGTPVAFVHTPNLPMVDVSMYFNAGSARDEAVKKDGFGIASLTASMLEKGTQHQDEEQIAKTSEQLGINLSANAYKDMFIVSLRSLSDDSYLDPAVKLFGEIITEPSFPDNSLARTKAQYLLAIEQGKEDPNTIADIEFDKQLYGNHPYAHPTIGTQQSITAIQREDLINFQRQFLVAKNANIAITGDISLDKAKHIANQLTHNMTIGNKAPALPDAIPLNKAKTVHIPFDSSQTSIIMGQIGNKRGTDEQTLQQQMNFAIANDVVGGSGFQARLMNEIRKNRGLTYGIYSSMTPMLSQGSYQISFSTRNDKADEGIRETLNIINTVDKNGISEQELNLTKDNLLNSFPLSFASNASINGTIGMMGFYGLPDNYLQNYQQRIDKATLNDVNKSFSQLIDTTKFLTVTVGNSANDKK